MGEVSQLRRQDAAQTMFGEAQRGHALQEIDVNPVPLADVEVFSPIQGCAVADERISEFQERRVFVLGAIRQAKLAYIAIWDVVEFVRDTAGQLVAAQCDPLQIEKVAQLRRNVTGQVVAGEPQPLQAGEEAQAGGNGSP